MHARRHQIIARSLRRRARHEGRLDLQKAVLNEIATDCHRDAAANREVLLHLAAAQIEIAVLQPHLFIRDGVLGGREGRRLRIVQQQHLVRNQLDVSGLHVRVRQPRGALAQLAGDCHHVLRPRRLRFGVGLGRPLLVEHHLRYAGAVAQIEKDEIAVIAAAVHPPHQSYGFAGVHAAQGTTSMCALQIA